MLLAAAAGAVPSPHTHTHPKQYSLMSTKLYGAHCATKKMKAISSESLRVASATKCERTITLYRLVETVYSSSECYYL